MTDSENDFAALLAEYDAQPQRQQPKVGQIVSGKIISIGAESVFVDLQAKSEGVIGREELEDDDGALTVQVGDTLEARVAEVDGPSGCIVLRRSVTRGADAHEGLAAAFAAGIPVDGLVSGVNKGGFDVEIAGVRAFCPVSQIDTRYVSEPESYVGQKFTFKITKLEPGRGKRLNLVVSRSELLKEQNAKTAAELRERLAVGLVCSGIVTTIKDYGVFVDLGGLEGMVHVSELSHQRIGHPKDAVTPGQRVDVKVVKIDPATDASKQERIALSIKALHDSPWEDAASAYREGQRLTGTIVRLQPFGAFVELAPGVEGLVHISELGAKRRINHPREVVQEGQGVEVTVLSVDPIAERISLSMRSPDEAVDKRVDKNTIAATNAKTSGSLGTFADLLKDKL